ncbi:DivIVA domain-containing protein [Glaciihabitans arcticus]|uniref:DivIVA domain-containing protein n=1 Tax=Glaciihabitans arcticus TaxID=2668039 RepID=A0A4Q9GRI6_9MICO|nr:DivIVA domain-containing protein [Glaciihabitans arcticus]TBN56208.1 DivIVA domain-containing protein [Glaciihabitans arcticus]
MSTTFPRTRKSRRGYNVDEVEDFLEDARRAYSAENGVAVVNSETIRTTAFTMQKGGYSTTHVDAALERLEDAFASRERDRAFAQGGDAAWYGTARSTAQVILDRLARPAGARFSRVGPLTRAYNVKEVDAFAGRLVDYFQHGKPMNVDEVRTVSFSATRRGYNETQVDLLLDSVITVMLAVR